MRGGPASLLGDGWGGASLIGPRLFSCVDSALGTESSRGERPRGDRWEAGRLEAERPPAMLREARSSVTALGAERSGALGDRGGTTAQDVVMS